MASIAGIHQSRDPSGAALIHILSICQGTLHPFQVLKKARCPDWHISPAFGLSLHLGIGTACLLFGCPRFLALCLCGKMYSQILTLLHLLSEDNVCQIYLCKRSTHRRIHRSTHTGHIFSPTGALYVIVPNYESSAGHFFFFFRF